MEDLSQGFWILVMLGAALVFAATFSLLVQRGIRKSKTQRRFKQGRQGEIEAVRLLERSGYRILDTQTTRSGVIKVDGTAHTFKVRADFLVEAKGWKNRGKQYVVEVKTGVQAPSPTCRATRRQMLEYQLLYQPDGLLLADMQSKKLHTIKFDFL